MRDEDKTKDQLLEELRELRQQVYDYQRQVKHFSKITELTSDWGYVIRVGANGDWRSEWISDSFYQYFGYSKGEIAEALNNKDILKYFHPDDKPLLQLRTEKIKAGQSDVAEYRVRTKEGQVRWVRDYFRPERVKGENAILVYGASQDITEHKQLRQKLEANQRKLEMIIDSIPILISYWDPSEHFLFTNKAYQAFFQYSKNELEYLTIEEAVGKQGYQRLEPYIKKALLGNYVEFEMGLQTEKGERHMIRNYIPHYEGGQLEGIIAIMFDITERKQLEIELKKNEESLRISKEESDKANKAKSQFLTNMSHEIRTPLGAIMGFNRVLLKRSEELALPGDFQKFLKYIQNSSEILSGLINNVLDLSKIEAGKFGISKEHFNIQQLVKTIFETYKFQADQKRIHFTYEIHPTVPSIIHSDRLKLMQILTNLIGNAIKFTPETKDVKLKVMGNEELLALIVVDEGIGIPKDKQQAIFDDFEQTDESISRTFGGSGLGLAITQKLVHLLGGKISVFSFGAGQGTTFNVRLPLEPVSIEENQALEINPPEYTFAQDNTVLVVEDNLTNQELIKAIFENFELKAHFANDGKMGVEKAWELYKTGLPPDLILMDMQLPVMDGVEAISQIRTIPELQSIPIVGLSADAYSEQKSVALSKGANDYLTKPIDIGKLLQVLHKYLRLVD